jgi:hypothetical protein
MHSQERRKNYRHRFPVLIPVEFTLQGSEEKIFEGFITNISASGLGFFTTNKMPKESEIMLQDNRFIPFRTAKVQWSMEAGKGRYNVGLLCYN